MQARRVEMEDDEEQEGGEPESMKREPESMKPLEVASQ